MAIAHDSASYPILGAAQAAGIDYGLALAWVDAHPGESLLCKDRIIDAHGRRAFTDLFDLIDNAHCEGRLNVRRWCA